MGLQLLPVHGRPHRSHPSLKGFECADSSLFHHSRYLAAQHLGGRQGPGLTFYQEAPFCQAYARCCSRKVQGEVARTPGRDDFDAGLQSPGNEQIGEETECLKSNSRGLVVEKLACDGDLLVWEDDTWPRGLSAEGQNFAPESVVL